MPNRLINETSPYLLQHAHNPVDWYPWGPEALEKAKREDKPIFLSIGYAACHWCHVMEHESFEDAATAARMNEAFVSIKVDREERPDLDSIYMNAVVAMTGQGGWPMSLFLTPEGQPVYGGTYYPNTRRYGMPAFTDVLSAIATAWKDRRAELVANGARLIQALQQDEAGTGDDAPLQAGTLDQAVAQMQGAFDWGEGGWGTAPKFPQPMALEFLIRVSTRTRDEIVLKMITNTLDKMARGGMYDQLGGGFHRYSTDANWIVPHFEKMLYDNALLARVYTHAWQVTQNGFYRRIAEQTLDYIVREMQHPDGGFYSTQDADSEGHEGKFFVWTPDEIRAAAGADAQFAIDAYGITDRGNFEGKNILFAARDLDVLAAMHKIPIAQVDLRLEATRQKLFKAREQRVKPARDEKVLTGWNGLMLAAFAEAARVFKRDDYRAVAELNATFLLREIRGDAAGGDVPPAASLQAIHRLRRSWKEGRARLNGYLEDYANLAEGLLALYETTFDAKWFTAARECADQMLAHFADPRGGFFDTSDDHEALVTRPKDVQDNAVPSGNAMAATALSKLAAYTGESRYVEAAERSLRGVQSTLIAAPLGFAQWLCALDFVLGQPKEIAIIGEGDSRGKLLEVVRRSYRPNQVVAAARPNDVSPIPLLQERPQLRNRATAYVCQHFACQMPVTEPEALEEQLSAI